MSIMAVVEFTRHLHRFFPAIADSPGLEIDAATIAELIGALETRFAGLSSYLINDDGSLRKHVVVFVDAKPIGDPVGLSDAINSESKVMVMQALSGG
jgi:hypothetical protein